MLLSCKWSTQVVRCVTKGAIFKLLLFGLKKSIFSFHLSVSCTSPTFLIYPLFHDPLLTLQMIPPLLALSQNRSKLKLYIAHLTDLCHDRDPSILSQLTPPSHYHRSDPEDWEDELQKMTVQQVVEELSVALGQSSLNVQPQQLVFHLHSV